MPDRSRYPKYLDWLH